MTYDTSAQHPDERTKICNVFKSVVIQNFHRCGVEMESDQLEISILEILCDFGSHVDNPEPLQFNMVSSSTALSETICGFMDTLKKAWDDVEQKQKEAEEQGMPEERFQQFEKQRKVHFMSFCSIIREAVPIFKERNLDLDEKHKLFLLVDLKDRKWEYRGILTYVLSEFFSTAKSYNEFLRGSAYDSFFLKFPNQTVLFVNYVDYYLRENALPDAELLIELSAAKYEGSESAARIYFDKSGTEEVSKLDEIGRESRIITSPNKRAIRKLMEISKRGQLFLYAEKDESQNIRVITTLVKAKPDTDRNTDKDQGLYIKFSGFMSWSIICDGREEIIYYHGKYWLNRSKQDKLYLNAIEHVKKKIEEKGIKDPRLQRQLDVWFDGKQLENLIEIISKQRHGTIVIITDRSSEAKRLCGLNRGTFLEVDKETDIGKECWNEEQLLGMTSIDGALFMNLKGQCLAMGVLMDGIAKKPGDVGRGARYNSTVNYIEQKEEGIYFGIIVSEDGMIDLACN